MFFILTLFITQISCQIIGLDFGTQWIKFAEFKNAKGFVILEDKMSKRKTSNIVSFCNGHPLYEYQGLKSQFKKNCKSFFGTNKYLYKNLDQSKENFNDKDFIIEKNNFYKNFIFEDKEFSKLIQSSNKKNQLTVEQIQALILYNIKSNIKLNKSVIDPQIITTVPIYKLNIQQRKSIKFIQQLAGFNPIGLIHENSAAALYYLYDRLNVNSIQNQNLVVINIGHNYSKFSAFEIKIAKNNAQKVSKILKTVKHFTTEKFNGKNLDLCLAKILPDLNEFSKQKQRAILQQIEDAKIKLSVNKEYKISINDFKDGQKFKKMINREDFYINCESQFDLLEKLLFKFKNSFQENYVIKNVQVIGGIVRIPRVKVIIENVFSQNVKNHINGDDGPALGSTLFATKLILSNYEKNLIFKENLNYHFYIQIENQEKQNIFNKQNFYGQQIKFLIDFKEELKFQIFDSNDNQKIYYQIKKIDLQNLTNAKIEFNLSIDYFGLLKINELKLTAIQTQKKDEKQTEKQIVKNLDYIILNIENKSILDNKDDMKQSRKLLKRISFKEQQKQYMGKIRNQLESLLFQSKEILKEKDNLKYLKESELKTIKNLIKRINKFVESEDFSFDDEKINKNILKLQNAIEPFKLRSSEHKNRKTLVKEYEEFLQKCLQIIHKIQQERYWVPPYLIDEQQQSFQREIENFQQQKINQQNQQLNEDPCIKSQELKNKKENFKQYLQQITTFPRNRKIYSFKYLLRKFYAKHYAPFDKILQNQLKKIKQAQ